MTTLIFAANWKMHLGPEGAREFVKVFLKRYRRVAGRQVWFFPPAVAIEAMASLIRDRPELLVGAQSVFWEPKGAFTGELSVAMVRESGADAALVGHSERRHVFGETIDETGKKVRALLDGGLRPVLCVGEKLEQREAGETLGVIEEQLAVLGGLDPVMLGRVVIAYEPVWAIGTGRTATPADAAQVHGHVRTWFGDHGVAGKDVPVLYGGSVKPANVQALIGQPEIDGVLVGGASLDPTAWSEMVRAPAN